MIDAEPITMPSMVSMKRALLARKLSTASENTSLKMRVERALASVLSNDFVSCSGLGTIVVAIRESYLRRSLEPAVISRRNTPQHQLIRRLPARRRCRNAVGFCTEVSAASGNTPQATAVLGCLPLACSGGLKDRFDGSHVLDCILERNRDLGIVQDRLREGVALQRVLVASRKRLGSDTAAKQI